LSQAAGILFSFRIADLIFVSLLGVVVLLTGLQIADQSDLAVIILLILVSALLFLLYVLNRFGPSIPWIKHYWRDFKSAFPIDARGISILLFWTTLAWSTKLFAYATILSGLLSLDLSLSLLSAISGELASSIPVHTPAGFGTFESGIVAVLLPSDIKLESALSAAINLHLFILTITLITTGFGVLLSRYSHDT
jgi:uncharacterized membrane protein YbhN (UPF0104 family)